MIIKIIIMYQSIRITNWGILYELGCYEVGSLRSGLLRSWKITKWWYTDVYRDQGTSVPLKSLCWAWSVLGPDQRTSADRRSVEKNLLVWSVPGPDQRTRTGPNGPADQQIYNTD